MDSAARFRWSVYALLIAAATGQMAGRILAVNSVDRIALDQRRDGPSLQRPFLSSNDRSRWMAVRALVEEGRWEIDGVLEEPNWDSIDTVYHRGRDGQMHFYSSKPPLMVAMIAAEYWLIHRVTGLTLADEPFAIGRFMLLIINVLPVALMLALVAATVERLVADDWAKLLAVAAGCFGTFITTFAVVLNNHIPAAVCAAVVLYAWVRLRQQAERPAWLFVAAGLAAAFAAVNELPALSLTALATLAFGWLDWRRTLVWFVPGVFAVAAAFFATNAWAHDSLRPPYAHRSETDPEDNWYIWSIERNGRTLTSYWSDRKGIDKGEQSKGVYTLHCLVGHHGVFSLTPVWLLSLWGGVRWLRRGDALRREAAAAVLLLSVVCLVFYIGLRPLEDRNYGGMTSGLRWMFWFIPMWLVLLAAGAEGAGRMARAFALVLLVFSCLSASYPTWNPWTHPWIVNWMEWCGWRLFG